MLHPEYTCTKLKDLSEDFITMYGLANKFLMQAGILPQELFNFKKRLNQHGYRLSPITQGLWRQDYLIISCTLPHKSQTLIYKIKLLQIVTVILSNCRFMLSQLNLFDLAVIFNVSDKTISFSCKNKCYILIHLQIYFIF